jgi:hypothetical protein
MTTEGSASPDALALAAVPLAERLRSFAKRAREYGVRATDPGRNHIETPIDWDELGTSMWAISAFDDAADALDRLAARAKAVERCAKQSAALPDDVWSRGYKQGVAECAHLLAAASIREEQPR